jgi:uncharacterized protein (TIGR02996 family)
MWRDNGHRDEAEKFLKSIVAGHDKRDQLPRLIFADWLDETGYPNAASGQRWLAKNNKTPKTPQHDDPIRPGVQRGWHMGGRMHMHGNSLLPEQFYWHAPATVRRNDNRSSWGKGTIHGGGELYHTGFIGEPHDPLHYERVVLDRSNSMKWHPETGEPLFNHDGGDE